MSRAKPRGVLPTILLVLAAAFWACSASTAQASCAVSDSRSPHAFTGLVVATHSHDRVATVETDDGQMVEVHGGLDDSESFSSLDRAFERGGRYEFHPTNTANPYQDDECTATRLLARVPLPPVSEETRQPLVPLLLAGLLGGVAAVVVLVRVGARRGLTR